jgi:hypothetical protein
MTETQQERLLTACRKVLRCDFLGDYTPILIHLEDEEETGDKIGAKRVSEALGELQHAMDCLITGE